MSAAATRAWKKSHPAAAADQLKRYRIRLRIECLQAYGGRCVDCGDENLDHLELDHEDGGGNEQRDEIFGYGHGSPGGWNFYRWLRKQGYPKDLKLACRCTDCHDKKHGRTKKDEGRAEPARRPEPRPEYASVCVEGNDLY